jgi:microcystin-dependent protein
MSGAESVALTLAQLSTHDHTLPPASDSTDSRGGGQPHARMQPSLALNYVIATEGLFPTPGGVHDETFIGQVSLFAGNFAPGGWEFADGRVLPIIGNEKLFSILGATYGGNGTESFALPDLRGRAIVHEGAGIGLSSRRLGDLVGAEQTALDIAHLPQHTHSTLPEPASGIFAMGLAMWAALSRFRLC